MNEQIESYRFSELPFSHSESDAWSIRVERASADDRWTIHHSSWFIDRETGDWMFYPFDPHRALVVDLDRAKALVAQLLPQLRVDGHTLAETPGLTG
jgi:hypothetical protein